MSYRFATERQDYTDYSSGRVFYNLPGHTAFPIRLGIEIFERCMELRRKNGAGGPVHLYDPCCGGAYHLAVLAYFEWDHIAAITASDIDPDSLSVARRNLSLLSMEGLEQRTLEIQEMYARYGKGSHRAALESARVLKGSLEANLRQHRIPVRHFQADALQPGAIAAGLGAEPVDMVFCDIPYGIKSSWLGEQAAGGDHAAVTRLLDNLVPVLSPQAVVALAATRETRVENANYRRAGRLKLGHRQVTFLLPASQHGH